MSVCDVQMFGSVSSILRVDADDVREQDCNTVRLLHQLCVIVSLCFRE